MAFVVVAVNISLENVFFKRRQEESSLDKEDARENLPCYVSHLIWIVSVFYKESQKLELSSRGLYILHLIVMMSQLPTAPGITYTL